MEEVVSARISEKRAEELRQYVEQTGVNTTNLIRQMLYAKLDEWKENK